MEWYEKCVLELTHHNMFESSGHRDRFRDLTSCYYTAPFFTKGLCKCMYLSSWDDEHFGVMLATLNSLIIDGDKNVQGMAEQGGVLSTQLSGADAEIYKLSTAFLTGSEYEVPDFTQLDSEGAHIIRKAILAGKYIDDLPDPKAS